jgi:hypothetical protein
MGVTEYVTQVLLCELTRSCSVRSVFIRFSRWTSCSYPSTNQAAPHARFLAVLLAPRPKQVAIEQKVR